MRSPRRWAPAGWERCTAGAQRRGDRKSTRLNSSHDQISYAVFCLKKKKKNQRTNYPEKEQTTIDQARELKSETRNTIKDGHERDIELVSTRDAIDTKSTCVK